MKWYLVLLIMATSCLRHGFAQHSQVKAFERLIPLFHIVEDSKDTSFSAAFALGFRYNKQRNIIDSVFVLCDSQHIYPRVSTYAFNKHLKKANGLGIKWAEAAAPFKIPKVIFLMPVFIKQRHSNSQYFNEPATRFWNHIWMPLYASKPWPPMGWVLLPPQKMFISEGKDLQAAP